MHQLQAYYKLQTRALNFKIKELKKIVYDQQEDIDEQNEGMHNDMTRIKEEVSELRGLASEIDVLS